MNSYKSIQNFLEKAKTNATKITEKYNFQASKYLIHTKNNKETMSKKNNFAANSVYTL